MNQTGVILFAHGARDPRWAEPFLRLQELVQQHNSDAPVALAFLELMSPSLPECAAHMVEDGCTALHIVPIFLGQGGHIRRDLPLVVEQLRAAHPDVAISVAKAAGEDAAVLQAMAQYCLRSLPTA